VFHRHLLLGREDHLHGPGVRFGHLQHVRRLLLHVEMRDGRLSHGSVIVIVVDVVIVDGRGFHWPRTPVVHFWRVKRLVAAVRGVIGTCRVVRVRRDVLLRRGSHRELVIVVVVVKDERVAVALRLGEIVPQVLFQHRRDRWHVVVVDVVVLGDRRARVDVILLARFTVKPFVVRVRFDPGRVLDAAP